MKKVINYNKLKGKIIEKGLTVEQCADALEIHRATLYRKLNGRCPVSIQDADAIVRVLNLSKEEACSIFFSQFVA